MPTTHSTHAVDGTEGLPIVLDLRGRDVVLVGGGPVTARRLSALVAAGARARVVAPALCEDVLEHTRAGRAAWVPRGYRSEDLDGAWLVHTATGDPSTDARVAADAHARRVFCVDAADASRGSARTPAVVRTRAPDDPSLGVTVAVHTVPGAGGDPARAGRLARAVADGLASGRLPLRRRRGGPGRVDLVGGGPGDPGLLTTRGRQLLAAADVVVHDQLAPTSLLAELDEDVVVVDVGKTAGHHPVPQVEINRLLVEYARAGRRVVRLKGGDPFVLGRGGEEALACLDAGVEVAVVPGVTSAVSVPAALGIPVTHRGVSRGFTVASAHDATDLDHLPTEGTLVLLMGITTLAETCARLVARGWPAATPAAVCEDGFGPRQRRVVGTLGTLPSQARAVGVRPPGIVVVGAVVGLAEQLAPSPPAAPPALVLVAHGSREPRSREVNERIAATLRDRLPGTSVVVAQLDHAGPRPDEALDALAVAGHRSALVQPLLFTPAYHVSVDLPEVLGRCRAVRYGLAVRTLGPLADHPLVLDALDRRLRELGRGPADALVLASAGTSSASARAGLADLARAWGLRHGVPAVAAFASAAEPTPGEAVAALRAECGRDARVVVGSLFLGPGFLPGRARTGALEAGAVAVAEPLADAPELVEVLLDRYRGACLDGGLSRASAHISHPAV
ncbi:uroporphyrinogen-III C-methyltransferase [Aquipuribacter sp. SD81]|uniref:uroporphyrinogen-III C-methyltransferase n=1 Tax=Aquipuribacter sp. SD81 TaxID=3127703 RepID=UPI0030196522